MAAQLPQESHERRAQLLVQPQRRLGCAAKPPKEPRPSAPCLHWGSTPEGHPITLSSEFPAGHAGASFATALNFTLLCQILASCSPKCHSPKHSLIKACLKGCFRRSSTYNPAFLSYSELWEPQGRSVFMGDIGLSWKGIVFQTEEGVRGGILFQGRQGGLGPGTTRDESRN